MPQQLTALIIALELLAGCSRGTGSKSATPPTTEFTMQPFTAGQVWTYRTRPGEEASRIVVCRVEQLPQFGEVVHIYVNGLQLKNKHAPGGICHEVTHLPYKADALRQCLLHLEFTGAPLPPFEDGYNEWHAAFTSEGAGVFTAPVADILAGTEAATGK